LLVRDGAIAAVGTRLEIESLPESRTAEKLEVGGRVALPGFVDSHTHLMHAASRVEEYELKIRGAATRRLRAKAANFEFREEVARHHGRELEETRARGIAGICGARTTTLEAKSGTA